MKTPAPFGSLSQNATVKHELAWDATAVTEASYDGVATDWVDEIPNRVSETLTIIGGPRPPKPDEKVRPERAAAGAAPNDATSDRLLGLVIGNAVGTTLEFSRRDAA